MDITPIFVFNLAILVLFTMAFFYQFIYILIVLARRSVPVRKAKKQHTYALVICAHNEGKVITELIESVKAQDYPSDKLDLYVFCDNCSDDTAQLAQAAGATVFERPRGGQVGKSWVMDFGLRKIGDLRPGRYEGFFVFDADNVLSTSYVTEMNNVFDEGCYAAVTSYRNSKNFDSSWVSRGYGTWFLREAKFLNNARMILGTSCAISGTGYLISAKVIEAMRGWDFHLLTEDIQFSTFAALQGLRIGYAHRAEFFDEQPITFSASWKQRMRWTKGFYQVLVKYGDKLLSRLLGRDRSDSSKGEPQPRGSWFSVYDMTMTLAPAMILTLTSMLVNAIYLILGILFPSIVSPEESQMCAGALIMTVGIFYLVFFLLAVLTTITEHKHIHATRLHLLTNLFTFPVFMLSYVPIAVAAAFRKVNWVPTRHTVSKTIEDLNAEGSGR